MAKVWNESHILQEPFQTQFFPLYKTLHDTFSKHIEIPREKPQIHQKIVNQKGFFHKTSSSQLYLIGTFSGPNPLSLRLLIMCLLIVIDLTKGNGQNQSVGIPFEVSSFNSFFFYFPTFLFYCNPISCFVYVITCFLRLVLQFFLCSKHVQLLKLGYLFMLYILLHVSGLGFLNKSHARMSLACIRRFNPMYAGLQLRTQVLSQNGLLVSHVLHLFKPSSHVYNT